MARLRHQSVFFDYADVPAAPLSSVPRLWSRPLAATLEQLKAEGAGLDEDLVRVLLDYQVLIPGDDLSDNA